MRNLICPRCESGNIVKNGNTAYGKPKFMCKDCRKHFVENPEPRKISDEKKELIDKLLLEKIPLAGIVRSVGVSKSWLQGYVNEKYENIERKTKPAEKEKKRLTMECDEMHSFVGCKENKHWIWFAIDAETREIVGLHVGSRGKEGAQALWDSLPPVYRQCAVAYTDFWDAYARIFPSTRHRPVGKHTGKTNHIERFNNTVRQRVSRVVRKTLSFSKKVENHIGAIWNFIHHYNKTLIIN